MKKSIGLLALYALPIVVFAQTLERILVRLADIINAIVPIVITLALIWFIWGVAQYVTADDADKKAAARDRMIYGAIALFVIVSIWGIVGILQQFVGIAPTPVPPGGVIPQVPGSGGFFRLF